MPACPRRRRARDGISAIAPGCADGYAALAAALAHERLLVASTSPRRSPRSARRRRRRGASPMDDLERILARAHLRPARPRAPPASRRVSMMVAVTANPYLPAPMAISRAVRELPDVFTWTFEVPGGFPFRPGQFNMLYVHGVGEVPISISGDPSSPERLVHTIRAVGAVTRVMARLGAGDVLGVRGPYGSAWPLEASRRLLRRSQSRSRVSAIAHRSCARSMISPPISRPSIDVFTTGKPRLAACPYARRTWRRGDVRPRGAPGARESSRRSGSRQVARVRPSSRSRGIP